MATIHAEIATSHEAACIAKQENSGATVLLRSGEAAKHVLLRPPFPTLGELDEQLLNHSGDNVARGDGVNSNVVGAPFGGEVASELNNSSLASIVGGANKTL